MGAGYDADASKEDIEVAIQRFYEWLTRNIDEGKMKMGSRLSRERAMVSKWGIVTDGPFREIKEIIAATREGRTTTGAGQLQQVSGRLGHASQPTVWRAEC